jgi:hypothetical protein
MELFLIAEEIQNVPRRDQGPTKGCRAIDE